jgi:hypothetical protein
VSFSAGRSTQLTIAFCLAWACDAAYQLLTGQTPDNVKFISLFVLIIGGASLPDSPV